MTMLIQNNKNWVKDVFFNFTFVKFVAFSIIYLFSCAFFIIVKFYILKNYAFYYYSGGIEVSDYAFLNDLLIAKSHFISIYYILFATTMLSLLLINWRENYFFIEKFEMYQVMFGLLLFHSITSNLSIKLFAYLDYLFSLIHIL
jgi:hypothetical protein